MDIYNISIIGLGYWGKNYIEILKKSKHNLICICCKSINTMNKYNYLECNKYLDYNEMFKKEKLDGVIIVTPTHTHKNIIIKAMKYNIKILTEKPICLNIKECKKVYNMSKKLNYNILNNILVGHTFLFNDNLLELKKLLNIVNNINYITFTWTNTYTIPKNSNIYLEIFVHLICIINFLFPNRELIFINKLENLNNIILNFKLENIIINLIISTETVIKERIIKFNNNNIEIIYDDMNVYNKIILNYINITDIINHIVSDFKNNIIFNNNEKNIKFNIIGSNPLNNLFDYWINNLYKNEELISNYKIAYNILYIIEYI